MKCVLIMTLAVLLTGCNTLIGVGRDTKIGYNWVSGKIRDMNRGGGGSGQHGGYDEGAPIY